MAEIKIMEKKWIERFAYNLRVTMEETGVSQAELARETGLSTGAIARYVSGERSPKAYHVGKIAEVLRVRTDDLLGGYHYY